MTVASSETTISMHFRHGSFNLCTCFFTMASNAMSGVNSPVLHIASTEQREQGAGATWKQQDQESQQERHRREKENKIDRMQES